MTQFIAARYMTYFRRQLANWSHGVMVSTLDFESSDPSSNLGGTSVLIMIIFRSNQEGNSKTYNRDKRQLERKNVIIIGGVILMVKCEVS